MIVPARSLVTIALPLRRPSELPGINGGQRMPISYTSVCNIILEFTALQRPSNTCSLTPRYGS